MNKYSIGVDVAKHGGDKTVVAIAKHNGYGGDVIFIDEVSNWPDYKWYRNPILWWKWHRLMKIVKKSIDKYAFTSYDKNIKVNSKRSSK